MINLQLVFTSSISENRTTYGKELVKLRNVKTEIKRQTTSWFCLSADRMRGFTQLQHKTSYLQAKVTSLLIIM